MADPIEIITAVDLVNYAQAGTVETVSVYVDLTNALVTEHWAEPTVEVPQWVKAIALEVAARPVRNPKGLASWTRSLDDGSRTERLPEQAARSGVFLLEHEKRDLRGVKGARRRLRPIRTSLGY